jgi:molybdopterin molybdotransferase
MPEFLELLPPAKALKLLFDNLPPAAPEIEEIATPSAAGRVLAEAVVAHEPLPAFARSTVDGFAVFAADTYGASDNLPVYLSMAGEVAMGRPPGFALKRTQAALIHTGGMLPEGQTRS